MRKWLYCIVTRLGDMIPRPLGQALHGDRPNEVIHIDFLYMGPGTDGKRYILIIREYLSTYSCLWLTDEATGEAAAEALWVLRRVFGSMQ